MEGGGEMRYVAVVGHKHVVFTSVIKIILYVRTDGCLLAPSMIRNTFVNEQGRLRFMTRRNGGKSWRNNRVFFFSFFFF